MFWKISAVRGAERESSGVGKEVTTPRSHTIAVWLSMHTAVYIHMLPDLCYVIK